ncbi:sodium-dependent transporter, partial [Escherichia coli]|nr:sodium-dependent transporter [Escherichia coli]
FRRPLMKELETHVNEFASLKLGGSWKFMLTLITPLSLLLALALTLKSIMAEGYGGYPASTLWLIGGGTIAFFILGAILFSLVKDRHS